MIFLSRDRSPMYVITPSMHTIIETLAGKMPSIQKGISVKFQSLDVGIPTTLLPTKMGEQVARGMLDTTAEAKRQKVDEAILNEFLLDHELHGIEFVGVDSDGEEDDQQAEAAIVTMGDGFFCSLCDKTLKNKSAIHGHMKSAVHQDNLNKQRMAARRELSAAQKSIEPETAEALAHGSAAAGGLPEQPAQI